jgi:photosystem II stability/assembly factor-like uncharacterized protein
MPFGPIAVSFASGSTGWMLGLALGRLELYKTVDGGRRWSALPAPPAPWQWQGNKARPSGVSGITFADARDGWLYGPGLWASHDGGLTWHRIDVHGAAVASVAAARGHVLAAFTASTACPRQCQSGQVRFRVWSSAASRDDWHPVPGAASLGTGQVAVTGLDGYALGVQDYGSGTGLVAGPAGAPGRWRHRPLPCGIGYFAAAIAVSRAGVVVACDQTPGEHPLRVREYRSVDGGRSWQRLAPLSLHDGAGGLTISPAGTIIIGGPYSGILISTDSGRTWHSVPSVDTTDAVGGGGVIQAILFSDRLGVALVQTERAWLTRDGGTTWTPITIPQPRR